MPTPRIRVVPYRQGSRSARALAQALGGKVLRLSGSTYTYREGDLVINWGSTDKEKLAVYWVMANLLDGQPPKNHADNINVASNKLKFFTLMKEKNLDDIVPRFWTCPNEIPDDAFPIVCRTVLAGHSGDGVHLANCRDDLVPAPLYTQYVKKKDEYRIHVGRLRTQELVTISQQRKARRIGVDEVNWQIRNHANGFVYVRSDVCPPPLALDVAHRCLSATGLDFGAVDVIWNEQQQRAYVLEINTAPGLEGQTVTDYANFFLDNFT